MRANRHDLGVGGVSNHISNKWNCGSVCCSRSFKFESKNWLRGCIRKATNSERPCQKCTQIVRIWKTFEVMSMLLILAGDIETNPGPIVKLTVQQLCEELHTLTKPIEFGINLGVPKGYLDMVKENYPNSM